MPPWDRYAAAPAEEEERGPWQRYEQAPPPRQQPLPRRGQSAPFWQEVTGALANVNRGIPFATDIMNVAQGVRSMAQGRPYEEGAQNQAAIENDFMARRPNAANLAIGTGAAAPLALTAGGSGAPQVAAQTSRGIPLFLRQTAQAGATGAATGEIYGIGTSRGSMQERLDAGNEAATLGGLTGAAAPAIIDAAAPVVRGLFGAARRIPTPAPNTLGANGGNLRVVSPPPQGPRVPVTAMNTIERLADRSGQNVSQLEARFGNIQRNPQGEVLADAFDTPGVQTLRPIAQSPGRTGQRAAQTARARIQGAQQRIMTQLTGKKGLNVAESRHAAVQRLENEYRDVSANAYAPMWRTPVSAEGRALYAERIEPLLQSNNPEIRRIMQRATRNAERQFNLDVGVGRVEGSIDDHLGRYLHYIKMELGELARFEARSPGGASGNRLGALRQLYRQFGDMLDPGNGAPAIIPGYRATTARAGDNFTALEALDEGAAFLRMRPEEVATRIQQMTPFERYHARVALADEVRHATRGRVVGNRNVANALVRDARADDDRRRRAMDREASAQRRLDLALDGSARNRRLLAAQALGQGLVVAAQQDQLTVGQGLANGRHLRRALAAEHHQPGRSARVQPQRGLRPPLPPPFWPSIRFWWTVSLGKMSRFSGT